MRRISRLERSIDLVRAQSVQKTTPYLCYACRQRAAPFSTSTLRTARPGEKAAWTDTLRQKIWGTDQPPGPENVYGDSAIDQIRKRKKQPEVEEKKAAAAPDLGDYEPADTWDGLERVGGYGHWWKDNWDPEHRFQGFMPPQPTSDPYEITAALHRAVVEAFALKHAGKPLSTISVAEPGEDLTHEVQLRPTESGAALQYPSENAFESIIESLAAAGPDGITENEVPTESEEDVTADRSEVDPLHPDPTPAANEKTSVLENPTKSEEDVAADRSDEDPLATASNFDYQELVASWDPTWLQVSLEDPEVKFAILKRTLQLTGIRVSDSLIHSTDSVQTLLSHLITLPKPRKLFEALALKEELATLPNVEIYAQRITPIDKERALGRWKVIEKELGERGLPITGR